MAAIMTSLIAGLLFGVGLIVSGMTNPAKVQNFLDIAGTFDPSLAFVMGGAVLTTLAGYRLAFARGRPLIAERFELPTKSKLDMPLVAGSALFGVGWGLAGYCPGPAVTALAFGAPATLVFVVAMVAGMLGARLATSAPSGPAEKIHVTNT